jgi:pantoate--beta-alanine ligase
MRLIRSIQEMQKCSLNLRSEGKIIGFVPTMGALHEGHFSLLRSARKTSDISVMSVFVNPKQFGPKEDFTQYPRPFEKDCAAAEHNGCDILFAPGSTQMYPDLFMTSVSVENLSEKLEGSIRPGHFKGVTTVVLKLFTITMPHIAVFGQKDAQQAVILKRMVKDLNLMIEVVILPTVRESDGLAMSSRNSYLTKEERKCAPLIYQGLCKAIAEYDRGELQSQKLHEAIRSVFHNAPCFKTEYIAIVDTETLDPVERITGKALIAVACRTAQTNTRLIDNVVLGGTL